MKKMIDNIRKYLPAVLLLVLLLFCIRYREDLSVERILSYTPEEPVKAALLMLGLYAVKSVSFIFPIAILQLAVGHLFSTGTALLVNFLGRAVTLALPYWMGRFSGASMVESLTAKYPKLKISALTLNFSTILNRSASISPAGMMRVLISSLHKRNAEKQKSNNPPINPLVTSSFA